MHDTAMAAGSAFAKILQESRSGDTDAEFNVLDLGGRSVNGSLRSVFEAHGLTYVCVDMEADASVDIVCPPGERLPFEDGSFDAVVSTSCFEHDPCFWMTFRELCRIVKLGGFIYVNAPSSGFYHGFPGDNWPLLCRCWTSPCILGMFGRTAFVYGNKA